TIAWSQDGLAGARRFLERVNGLAAHITNTEPTETTTLLHKTIKKVSEDIEQFKFNTAISAMMIFVNHAEKAGLTSETYRRFLQLLAPFAPHLTEELWTAVGESGSVHASEFPTFDPALAVDQTVTIGVQVDGKVRGEITVAPDAPEDEAVAAALANASIKERLSQRGPARVIYVPGRILNLMSE
ncbi:MAG: class I tRNA ligase family protein, partial [Patescibacteria group bacterium]